MGKTWGRVRLGDQVVGAQALPVRLTSRAMTETIPPEVSQGALSRKQTPGLADPRATLL